MRGKIESEGLGAVPGCFRQSYKTMNKDQKELLKGNKWRELLDSLGPKEVIPVTSVGEIKSIRSVASDLNTDKDSRFKYTINADRELMLVTITKTDK